MSAHDFFQGLVDYHRESRETGALDRIPEAMNNCLDLTHERIFIALANIHAMHARWSTRMSVARGASMAAMAAKEVGFARIREEHRHRLNRMYHKVTVDRVDDAARSDSRYAHLCLAEAEAMEEYLRLRGLVDAIVTKREALRVLGGVLAREMYMAGNSYSTGTVENLDEAVKQSLSSATEALEELSADIQHRGRLPREKEKEEGQEIRGESRAGRGAQTQEEGQEVQEEGREGLARPGRAFGGRGPDRLSPFPKMG